MRSHDLNAPRIKADLQRSMRQSSKLNVSHAKTSRETRLASRHVGLPDAAVT